MIGRISQIRHLPTTASGKESSGYQWDVTVSVGSPTDKRIVARITKTPKRNFRENGFESLTGLIEFGFQLC